MFPVTGTRVSISLPGNSDGPTDDARRFHRQLPEQFEGLLSKARPEIDRTFEQWIGRPLSADLWEDVRLGGFALTNASRAPTTWEVTFETTGEKWIAITIPFVGDSPQEAVVDT
jgi:hypothetical protein